VLDRADRIILIINDMTIKGNTRMQKYGFLIHKLYANDLQGLNFYSDWKPYLYGPYSEELKQDLQECIKQKLVVQFNSPTESGRQFSNYNLSMKGRVKLRNVIANYEKTVKELYEKFTKLNRTPIISILKDIYLAYPEYTVKSEIKESVMND